MNREGRGKLESWIRQYGYWAVLAVVGAEGIGFPVPGEAALVAASIYAGETGGLDIGLVILASSLGAFGGSMAGFWIGREFGYDLVLRYGRYVHFGEAKLKIGEYLFLKHGGKVVFFGRFTAFLRTYAALLAGINQMPVRRFASVNALASLVWSALFGWGGYILGAEVERFRSSIGLAAVAVAVAGVAAVAFFLRRNWRRIEAEAGRQFPGPLTPRHPHGRAGRK